MKLTQTQKQDLINAYHTGIDMKELIMNFKISKSTFYRIIKNSSASKNSDIKQVSYKEYLELNRKYIRQSKILELIKISNFSPDTTLDEKLELYQTYKNKYSTNILLEAFNISKGTYSNRILNNKVPTFLQQRKEFISSKILEVFNESEQRLGSAKIQAILKEQNINTSKKYILKLMKEIGISSISNYSKSVYKQLTPKQNILNRQFNPGNINEVWVSDVTYFKVKEYYLYTCVIMDLFSRKIISYTISKSQSTKLITSTFKKAYNNRNPSPNLIFHSDRGGMYVSGAFRLLLKNLSVTQSFSNPGTPHDNAVIESFFKILKAEELYRRDYTSDRHFKKSIEKYINYYNDKRPHLYNNYQTPTQKEILKLTGSN